MLISLRQCAEPLNLSINIKYLIYLSCHSFYNKMLLAGGGCYSCPSNCTLVADLFLFSYDRDFMLSFSDNNQADVVEAFNSTPRYLDALLNIDNPYFAQMVSQIYPTELQLNKANPSE